MSDISIRQYSGIAKLDETGTIRVSRDDDSKLVNKGTRGHRLSSWLRNIGEKIGLVGRDETRAKRQIDALEGFKKALAGTFGSEVAEQALTGMGVVGTVPLTGRIVEQAIRNSETITKSNLIVNNGTINKLLPPIPPGEPTPEFEALVKSLGEDMNITLLSEQELNEFESRFVSLSSSIDLMAGRKPEELEALARQTLAQVHELTVEGKLERAVVARQEYVAALTDVLHALAEGRSPKTMIERLAEAARLLQQHGQVEGEDAPDVKALTRAVLRQAMFDLNGGDPAVLVRALENALAKDSSLRAVLAQIELQPRGELSPRQLTVLDTIKAISETIVEGLGVQYGPEYLSPQTDVERLNDSENLKPSRLREAMRPLVKLLDLIRENPTAPKELIDTIKEDYAYTDLTTGELKWHHDNKGNPEWNTVEVLETLERHVRRYAVRDRLSIDFAIENMRAAIFDDPTLPQGLKDKLSSALDAIAEEFRLRGTSVGSMNGFENLQQEDFWHLFAPRWLVDGNNSKWVTEHAEPGSLAGMQRAFRDMLQSRQGGELPPLTAQELLRTHSLGTHECSKQEVLQILYNEETWPETIEDYLPLRFIPSNFRDNQTNLKLRMGEVTLAGLDELQALGGGDDPWFELVPTDTGFDVNFKVKTSEESEARAQQILDDYYTRLPDQQTNDQKRLLIAETIQALYRSHVFMDGNSRTVVFTAMNRLLMDVGLSPAILPAPKGAAGFSREEFAHEILKGQIAFQLQARPQGVEVVDLIAQQIQTLEAEGMDRPLAITTLRNLIDGNQGLTDALRTQALRALDAEARRMEDSFYTRLLEVGAFQGLKRQDVWRLFGNTTANWRPQLELSFETMLAGRNTPFGVDEIESINNVGPYPGFRPGLDEELCRTTIDGILGRYQGEISEAITDDAKRLAIANAVKALYEGQFFPDLDSQFTVLMVMNRMLVDAGLTPVMLDMPGVFETMSVEGIAREIARGQINFRYYAREESTTEVGFVMDEMRRRVLDYGSSPEQALSDLRDLIEGDRVIPAGEIIGRIGGVLEAMPLQQDVEVYLYNQLDRLEKFDDVSRDDVWRLGITGTELDGSSTREDFVLQHGLDTLVGLERAYGVMLGDLQSGNRLDVEQVLRINNSGPTPGFRQGETTLTLDYGGWLVDREGIDRFMSEDPWFEGGEIREIGTERPIHAVTLPSRTDDECQQKLQSILETHHREMLDIELEDGSRTEKRSQREVDDSKRAVIARTVQEMYRAQIFAGGERQPTVFIVMNRLLLEAGLEPGIYREPLRAFGFPPSVHGLFVGESQAIFRHTFSPPIETNDLSSGILDQLSSIIEVISNVGIEPSDNSGQVEEVPFTVAIVDGRLVGDARPLLSLVDRTNVQGTYRQELLDDMLDNQDNGYPLRQQRMNGRELVLRPTDGEDVPLLNAMTVANTIETNVTGDIQVQSGQQIYNVSERLAPFLNTGLFDRLYQVVVGQIDVTPDREVFRDRPERLEFTIEPAMNDGEQPLYNITIRGRIGQYLPNMPQAMDLVVTLQVDPRYPSTYDQETMQVRVEGPSDEELVNENSVSENSEDE